MQPIITDHTRFEAQRRRIDKYWIREESGSWWEGLVKAKERVVQPIITDHTRFEAQRRRIDKYWIREESE